MENVLQRIRELSVQAGNSTLSSADRSSIQKEVDALINELIVSLLKLTSTE